MKNLIQATATNRARWANSGGDRPKSAGRRFSIGSPLMAREPDSTGPACFSKGSLRRARLNSGRLPLWKGWSRLGIAAMTVALLGALPFDARACVACNLTFEDEVLNQRADTLAGRDMQAAMANQRDLPLEGLSEVTPREPRTVRQDSPLAASAPAPVDPAAAAPSPVLPENWRDLYSEDEDFIEIIRRDENLSIPQTSYVSQDAVADKTFTIELDEGLAYLGNGVVYEGFLTNGIVPGPTIVVEQGDVVEFIVVNNGTIPHGASIHAAYTQTSKYLGQIQPGQTKSVKFRATYPGVFMYHCAPGGHAIPMHVLFGQYGMMVVKPKDTQYKLEEELGHEPDVEIYLIQHEWYASGKDAVEGNPMYVTFNGKLFRYIEEPIQARPGDYVRIYFLNIGPNLLSTFHLVGIIWDYAYWQGHPEAVLPGGQTVTAGPSDSWVVEFRVPPEEGAYTMLSHAVGSTSRGAIGLLVGDRNAETPVVVKADGPRHTQEELTEMAAEAVRVISPFKPGTAPVDQPVVYGPETEEVMVSIIGNSYYPKVLQVAPGTTVTFVNEDVFSYLAGEFSGIHNAVSTSGPDRFVSPLLAHGETYSFTFELEGEYDYICTPHPYMEGRIIVKAPSDDLVADASSRGLGGWAFVLAGLAVLVSFVSLLRKR